MVNEESVFELLRFDCIKKYVNVRRQHIGAATSENVPFDNCVFNRLMSILFSIQSRNFIKLNKSKHLRITLLFFFTCYIENLINFSIPLSHISM